MQTTESKRGPGRPRSLTLATEKTIARRYATGKWTLAALAEHYGIAVGTVRAIVKRNPAQAADLAESRTCVDGQDVDPLPQSYCAGDSEPDCLI